MFLVGSVLSTFYFVKPLRHFVEQQLGISQADRPLTVRATLPVTNDLTVDRNEAGKGTVVAEVNTSNHSDVSHMAGGVAHTQVCLLYTSPSPRD